MAALDQGGIIAIAGLIVAALGTVAGPVLTGVLANRRHRAEVDAERVVELRTLLDDAGQSLAEVVELGGSMARGLLIDDTDEVARAADDLYAHDLLMRRLEIRLALRLGPHHSAVRDYALARSAASELPLHSIGVLEDSHAVHRGVRTSLRDVEASRDRYLERASTIVGPAQAREPKRRLWHRLGAALRKPA